LENRDYAELFTGLLASIKPDSDEAYALLSKVPGNLYMAWSKAPTREAKVAAGDRVRAWIVSHAGLKPQKVEPAPVEPKPAQGKKEPWSHDQIKAAITGASDPTPSVTLTTKIAPADCQTTSCTLCGYTCQTVPGRERVPST